MTEPPLATQPSRVNRFRETSAELRFFGRKSRLAQLGAAGPAAPDAVQNVTEVAAIGTSPLASDLVAWLIGSQLDLAEALHRTAGTSAPVEARAVARQAHALATELELPHFIRRAEAVVDSLGAEPESAVNEPHSDSTEVEILPRISVMGRFQVTAADGSFAHWTSRKARMILQLLVASRGAPVSRERLMDYVWPGEAPDLLSNRLSVAISTVRRALDPVRQYSAQHFLRARRNVLQLNVDQLTIDVEDFLRLGRSVVNRHPRPGDAALDYAIQLYAGEVFADEPYEDWAQQLRMEARNLFADLCRLRAESASLNDNSRLAAELHRKVLSVDGYDENAHRGLIAALDSLGVNGQARSARATYHSAMSELARESTQCSHHPTYPRR